MYARRVTTTSSSDLDSRLKRIALVVLDVDGVLTDGRITYLGPEVGWTRTFHVHDGHGIKLLLRAGLPVAVLSADDNPAMRARVAMLGIEHAEYGCEDKRDALTRLQSTCGATDATTLYMGDELFDVPIIERVAVGVSVADARPEARAAADFVTERGGGRGAVREVIDRLRAAKGMA